MTLGRRLRAAGWTGRERWLLTGAALALAMGFLGPEWPLERALFEHVVVLDITQSMNVLDQRPGLKPGERPVSRLVYAKQALHRALNALPCGSKLGWGVFTEHRSVLLMAPVEVCANLVELRATLADIDSRMAWIGNSEVAKGLHSAQAIARQLPGVPSLVFLTDGHEAPPINPRHRPAFEDPPVDVRGVIVGVGERQPSPIPRTDPLGRSLGLWQAGDVLQTDRRSLGRGASISGERMVEDGLAAGQPALGATPGTEHLSGLREPYLRLLAAEQGLAFHRLGAAQDLVAALSAPALSRPVSVRADGRVALAALALALLLARHVRLPARAGGAQSRRFFRPRETSSAKRAVDR